MAAKYYNSLDTNFKDTTIVFYSRGLIGALYHTYLTYVFTWLP